MTFRFAGKSDLVAIAIILIMMLSGLVRADVEREKFLLLDKRIVAGAENAKLAVGTVVKDKRNPLFT